jgi:hypothetical protein
MAAEPTKREIVDLGHGLTARVAEVTPAMAEKWLDRNHDRNRSVNDKRVEAMASDMRTGHWRLTHQGICFDAEGVLIDGQHRLWAVMSSGCSVRMLVVGNAHGELSDPIDTCGVRSTSFLIGERTNVVAAGTVLRFLEVGYKIHARQTSSEVAEVLDHHREHLDAIRFLPKCHSLPGPIMAALAYSRPLDPARVEEFARKFSTGEMLQRGDPEFALRNWIVSASGRAANNWDRALATLAAIRYAIHGGGLKAIYVTEEAYRGITTRRRAMKIPHTPSSLIVPSSNWRPSNLRRSMQDEE